MTTWVIWICIAVVVMAGVIGIACARAAANADLGGPDGTED